MSAALLFLALLAVTSGWWTPPFSRILVCNSAIEEPDLILIDNLDPNYLLFERAQTLKLEGHRAPVLVPVFASPPRS